MTGLADALGGRGARDVATTQRRRVGREQQKSTSVTRRGGRVMDRSHTHARRGALRRVVPATLVLAVALVVSAAFAAAATAATEATCRLCGKNLIKNPGAEAGAGITAVGAYGAVPGWTNEAGQFGAASYTFPNGWFSKTSKGSPKRGKNYFFGGTTTAAVTAKLTIGKQTIKLPAAAAGRKVTLGGWLGNYGAPGDNTSQVRAEFADASGAVLARLRIGNDTTISGTDMAFRSRKGTVPRGATQVTIVVSFQGLNAYKLAGADDLSLVLA
jgi:hypothetical protein